MSELAFLLGRCLYSISVLFFHNNWKAYFKKRGFFLRLMGNHHGCHVILLGIQGRPPLSVFSCHVLICVFISYLTNLLHDKMGVSRSQETILFSFFNILLFILNFRKPYDFEPYLQQPITSYLFLKHYFQQQEHSRR